MTSNPGRRPSWAPLLFAAVPLVAVHKAWLGASTGDRGAPPSLPGAVFVPVGVASRATGPVSPGVSSQTAAGDSAASPPPTDGAQALPASASAWALFGGACALAAAQALRGSATAGDRRAPAAALAVAPSAAAVPLCLEAGLLKLDGSSSEAPALVAGNAGLVATTGTRDEGVTAMAIMWGGFKKPERRITGRRRRLGVAGNVCMLTGRKKIRGYYRTFSEKKVKRYWRPNTGWKKIWWEKEQKWVRLFVSAAAIKLCDRYGLEHVATRAGLDLYAWVRPHWHPGSRQPLRLRISHTDKAKNDLKFHWKDYLPKLNKGAALCDIMAGPERPVRWYNPKPYKPRETQGAQEDAKRLVVDNADKA